MFVASWQDLVPAVGCVTAAQGSAQAPSHGQQVWKVDFDIALETKLSSALLFKPPL